MNYRGIYKWVDLQPCSVCGKYAGARKVSVSWPEKFFVVCQSCGHKTRGHDSQIEATKEWNRHKR